MTKPAFPSRNTVAAEIRAALLWSVTALALPLLAVAPAVAQDGVGVIEAPAGAAKSVPEMAFSRSLDQPAPAGGAVEPRTAAMPGTPPVVIELFTSQGCSSCPAADALIGALSDQPGVLTLTWHVDYWDYLGWPDHFARPEHTARQEGYAAVAGEHGVYTPQIIVDGQDTLLSLHPGALLGLIEQHAAHPAAIMVTASTQGGAHVIQLTPRAAIPGGVDVALIRFLPHRSVQVDGGENLGLTLDYRNVVVGSELLTHWSARSPLRLTVRAGEDPGDAYPDDTRHAILVQQVLGPGRPGPILAAVRLD